MHSPAGRQNAIRRRDTTDLLSSYINQQVHERQRRSSIVVKKTPDGVDVPVIYKRTRSNPTISDSMVQRLERRRSAVTFQSTYRNLHTPTTKRPKPASVSSITDTDSCCYGVKKNPRLKVRFPSASADGHFFTNNEMQASNRQIRIRKSLE